MRLLSHDDYREAVQEMRTIIKKGWENMDDQERLRWEELNYATSEYEVANPKVLFDEDLNFDDDNK